MAEPRRLWTPEEDARLIAMRAEGLSVKQAAAALGRPFRATHLRIYVLRKSGVEVAEARQDHPDAYSPEEDRRIFEMRAKGATTREIAAALGRTQLAVSTHIRLLRQKGVTVPDRAVRVQTPEERLDKKRALNREQMRKRRERRKAERAAIAPPPAPKPAPEPVVYAPKPEPRPLVKPQGSSRINTPFFIVPPRPAAVIFGAYEFSGPALRMSTDRREVARYLADLGAVPADLELVEALCARGERKEAVAKRFGIEVDALVTRFRALTRPIRLPSGVISTDGLAVIVAALRGLPDAQVAA